MLTERFAGIRFDSGGAAVLPQPRLFQPLTVPQMLSGWLRTPRQPAAVARSRTWVFADTKSSSGNMAHDLVQSRLSELRELAAEDDIALSAASEQDLGSFLRAAEVQIRPALYLLDDGRLRAKWVDLHGQQIAIAFDGAGRAEFVFFVLRSDGTTSRIIGRDTLDGMLTQVRALGLTPLMRD